MDAVAKKNAERLRGYTLHAEPLLDYFVASCGPYFCLYPVVCFGSDFFSCMTNAGVMQEINGISAQTAYGIEIR